jgi:hypothetical protein
VCVCACVCGGGYSSENVSQDGWPTGQGGFWDI